MAIDAGPGIIGEIGKPLPVIEGITTGSEHYSQDAS
jgi:hypothetical protein